MADPNEKNDDLAVVEAQDGSATVDLPEDLTLAEENEQKVDDKNDEAGHDDQAADAEDHPDDDEELRNAKRNRRRAKKELIRKTNQEKDVRLQQLQRENEEFRRRLNSLERNTKAEHITRLEKSMDDAQVRMEYAKMKLAEAASSSDGNAMVEAQQLWDNARDEVRRLNAQREQASREMQRPPEIQVPDLEIQRQAAVWMRRNPWYNPNGNDHDSKVAKKVDELLSTQGLNPSDPDYWDELDARLQKELPHRYNEDNDDDSRQVRRPRNVVGSAGREASASYGGVSRNQFVLSPERVKAMKDAGAWDNPERKAKMIKQFIAYDRANRN